MSLSKKIEEEIADKLKDEGARRIAIFGSYSRNEERPDSDIDILVDFSDPKSLLDITRIERELFSRIGTKVDLVTEKSLSPYIKDRVNEEKKVIA